MSIDMYLPAFSQITRDLGARPGAVQLTLAVYLLAAGLSQAFYGALADRFGRRLPLLTGCALYTLGSLGCMAAPTVGVLVAARVLQALGGASGMVIARAVVRDLYDERASARIFSELMLVTGIAPIVAPWVGGQMLLLGNWRLIFMILAGFGAVCFLATWWGLPETHPLERRLRDGVWKAVCSLASLFRHRSFVGYALVGGFTSGTLFAYISDSSFVYIDLYGVSPQHFGYFFGINALGMMGAGQVNRWMLRRWTPESILGWALVANVLLALALLACGVTGWGGLPLLAGCLFATLLTFGFAAPNFPAAAMAPFGRKAGSASAVLGLVQFALGGLSGAAVGFLHNGTAQPMTATMVVCGLGALTAFLALTGRAPAAEAVSEA